jgi:hypothetical protein
VSDEISKPPVVPQKEWLPKVIQLIRPYLTLGEVEQNLIAEKVEARWKGAGAKAKEIFAAQMAQQFKPAAVASSRSAASPASPSSSTPKAEALAVPAKSPWVQGPLAGAKPNRPEVVAAATAKILAAAKAEPPSVEASKLSLWDREVLARQKSAIDEPSVEPQRGGEQTGIKSPEPEPSEEPSSKPSPEVMLPATVPLRAFPSATAPAVEPEILEMNAKHAVISDLGSKVVVLGEVPSVFQPGTFEMGFQTFQAFRDRYSNKHITVATGPKSTKSVPLAPYWLSHPDRRQYEGLDLVPNGPKVLPGGEHGYLNLWRGWGVPPQKGSWKLIQRHVAEVLADGDQKFEDYILRFTAWKFQNPAGVPGVSLVLRGGKGSGKGVWGDIHMRIYGQHGIQVYNSQHVTGKHNSHLQNKLFLFSDEATWAGDREAERVLKAMITEKALMIEPKGINAFPWPNRLAVYMAANSKWVVPASYDERRFAVNTVSERWKQNPVYFRPLLEEIANGGAGAMLHDLLAMDLDGWLPSENIPYTKALLEQKLQGLTGLEQWYVYMLGVGLHPPGGIKNPRRVLSKRLLTSAKDYSPRNRYITDEELAAFLKEHGFVSKSDGIARGWVFLPLAEARDRWLARVGGNWSWDHPDLAEWGAKPEEGT